MPLGTYQASYIFIVMNFFFIFPTNCVTTLIMDFLCLFIHTEWSARWLRGFLRQYEPPYHYCHHVLYLLPWCPWTFLFWLLWSRALPVLCAQQQACISLHCAIQQVFRQLIRFASFCRVPFCFAGSLAVSRRFPQCGFVRHSQWHSWPVRYIRLFASPSIHPGT